jgi:class 3 adenylate cyclase/pimeloyl-ACP methyl ester carboxylesterase
MEIPETRYARSGDLSIAYQVFGEGPRDIVFVPGFISHCDLSWETPLLRGIAARLGSIGRTITFDKRGTGLSDRSLGFGTAEDRMDDIRAVMDTAGCDQAAVVGLSEGGPLAILFAATYPERVTALALWDTWARVLAAADYTIGADPSVADVLISAICDTWGSGEGLRVVVQHMPSDAETNALLARYERSAATPTGVREVQHRNVEIDVRSALSAVSAPTLVLHRRRDPVVPIRFGRYLADHIVGAKFVEMPGDWHTNGSVGGEDDALDVVEEFLTGSRQARQPEPDRVLKTVLFTDIVASTERAAELGDRHWRELLDAHDGAIRRELERFRGEEVKTTGDGFLAAFDGPGRAISCAHAIATGSHELGLEIRSGLHTGECELRGDDLAGIAVHIGARVAALAAPGEVLVTSTVRDLVAGSGIEFADRGSHMLKGVPGKWDVLAVRG